MRYANIWQAISDTPEQALNLAARAERMNAIESLIHDARWTPAEAAVHCGVSEARVNALLRGQLSRFSLKALAQIAGALQLGAHRASPAPDACKPKRQRSKQR